MLSLRHLSLIPAFRFSMKKKQIKPQPPPSAQKHMDTKLPIPASIYSKNGNTFLVIAAKPNAKVSQVVSLDDEAIGVAIGAAPRDGEANSELILYISDLMGVKKSCISLDRGQKSRHKTLIVDGDQLSPQDAYEVIKECLG